MTKAALESSIGKVLIIDEAYGLSGSATNGNDIYKTAVIDTMVAEIQSVPGEDRCVLLLGYKDEMERMFDNVNPGLKRRFQLSDAFYFADFSDDELIEILHQKLRKADLSATEPAVKVAIGVLSRQRNTRNFGNAGDVENLIGRAKMNYQARQAKLPPAQRSALFEFEPIDFDQDFDRTENAEEYLEKLFKDVIGQDTILQKLKGFARTVTGMKARDIDPRGEIPMNFIFKGPPGIDNTLLLLRLIAYTN